jgi:hypothetical protein
VYDPHVTLDAIDAHKVAIVLLAGGALVCNYVWFVEAYRVARRDRAYSLPLFCTLFWFAHDGSYVYRYSDWFGTYSHWFPKLFWVGLVVTSGFEVVFVAQLLRYGRKELAPQVDQGTFTAAVVAAIVASALIWEVVKGSLADPLYLYSLGVAIVAYPPFGMALLIQRRSRQGQSVVMWLGFLGTAVGWFVASTLWFGPDFRTWRWLALGAVSIGWGIVTTVLVHRAPAIPPMAGEPVRPAAATNR